MTGEIAPGLECLANHWGAFDITPEGGRVDALRAGESAHPVENYGGLEAGRCSRLDKSVLASRLQAART